MIPPTLVWSIGPGGRDEEEDVGCWVVVPVLGKGGKDGKGPVVVVVVVVAPPADWSKVLCCCCCAAAACCCS